MNTDWRSRYELAIEACEQAGRLALGYFDRPMDVEAKADLSPVTAADKGAEELLRAAVGRHFPDDGFLGEEFGEQPGGSGYRWVIDPIDGTKKFVRGMPLWGTLVGLEYRGEPIAGIARIPAMEVTYHACRGEGAYRDGRRIRVSDVGTLAESHFCFTTTRYFTDSGRDGVFPKLLRATASDRGFGDLYGFLLVAQGSCEFMVDHGCKRWDLAGLKPIVEEAGGRFTNWSGVETAEGPDVLASNGKVHDAVLAILSDSG